MNGLERALVVGCENIDPVGRADKDSRGQTDENKRDRDVVRLLLLRQYLDDVEINLTTPEITAGCQS